MKPLKPIFDHEPNFIAIDDAGRVLVSVWLWDDQRCWWTQAKLAAEVEANIGELVRQALAGEQPGIRFVLGTRPGE